MPSWREGHLLQCEAAFSSEGSQPERTPGGAGLSSAVKTNHKYGFLQCMLFPVVHSSKFRLPLCQRFSAGRILDRTCVDAIVLWLPSVHTQWSQTACLHVLMATVTWASEGAGHKDRLHGALQNCHASFCQRLKCVKEPVKQPWRTLWTNSCSKSRPGGRKKSNLRYFFPPGDSGVFLTVAKSEALQTIVSSFVFRVCGICVLSLILEWFTSDKQVGYQWFTDGLPVDYNWFTIGLHWSTI